MLCLVLAFLKTISNIQISNILYVAHLKDQSISSFDTKQHVLWSISVILKFYKKD